MLYNMSRMRNTCRRGDITITASGLVGVLVFVAVVSLVLLAGYVLAGLLVLAAIAWPVLLLVEKLLPTRKAAPIVHPRDTEAGRRHAARMAALLNR